MKKIAVVLIGLMLASCGTATKEKVVKLNYSLLDSIYTQVDKQEVEKVRNVVERHSKVLKQAKYIKVYRGSYRDDNGNVVEGGFEYIRIDDGIPDTNF